jgi:hypothetical protein
MIDWRQTPPGSVAHIYWPQLNATDVLNLANRLYATHLLSASDSNTIDCTVGRGVTYVPIPPGTTENIAGLLTIDLPMTVVTGQEFDILVRRGAPRRLQVIEREVPRMAEAADHGGGTWTPETEPGGETQESEGPPEAASDEAGGEGAALLKLEEHGGGTWTPDTAPGGDSEEPEGPPEAASDEAGDRAERAALFKRGAVMRNWRYVTGTFQVKIPVTTDDVMLRPDEDALAVMKWRLQQIAPKNRWRPVLERYISYLGARITGLGGNPDEIPPSPEGAPLDDGKQVAEASFTGKVDELVYDCFGRFEGFVLAGCRGEKRAFQTTECRFEEILLKACKLCLLVTVYLQRGKEECIRGLVVHC